MAILNKLTPQKFKTLVEQVMALNIETPERLEGVIDRIFEKVLPLCSLRRNTRECPFNYISNSNYSNHDGKMYGIVYRARML